MSLTIVLAIVLALIVVGIFAKQQTWTRRFALAVDIFTASIIWSQWDVTISSRCGLAIRAGSRGNKALRALGWVLNHLQANHCELAIRNDQQRAADAIFFLHQ